MMTWIGKKLKLVGGVAFELTTFRLLVSFVKKCHILQAIEKIIYLMMLMSAGVLYGAGTICMEDEI